ncbi:MAG: twin-arginine translocase subunit TatC [Bacteroidales bacterium]
MNELIGGDGWKKINYYCKKPQDEMSFLEHLEELRWHLIRSVLAIFIIAIVAFIYHDVILT